jgi:hypothetical protein
LLVDLNGSVVPCALSDAKKWAVLNGLSRNGPWPFAPTYGELDGVDEDIDMPETLDLKTGAEYVDMGDAAGESLKDDEESVGVYVDSASVALRA